MLPAQCLVACRLVLRNSPSHTYRMDRNMHYIAANIGRNIGDTPMSRDRWQAFQAKTADILTLCTPIGVTAQVINYDGEWQGAPEDAAHVFALSPKPLTDKMRIVLESALADLAQSYSQDAIALIVGESTLV